ncbi:chemokine (C motif) receptor 1a, duplicate 1 isoform X2 [Echeneis naucrates]|nr:chemokine XC receptor 1-like isoform X2 [Echeneis naucrates]
MNESFNGTYYEYVEDYDDEVCEKQEVVVFGSIAVPVFFSVVITLSLTGNILVLVILAMYENLKSLTNLFILNLAISDLIFTSGLPFWAIYHIKGWMFSEIHCKIVTFIFTTGFYSSILFLAAMTIYRYRAVVHPLSDVRSPKFSYSILLSLLIWVISIGVAVPSFLFSTVVQIPHKYTHSQGCEYQSIQLKAIAIIQQNIFFLAAFVVMGFCYIQILRRITRTRSHTKNRAVKLVFCIVAVFFIGWVPYNVTIFLTILADNLVNPFHDCKLSIHLDYVFHVCRLIAFSHCCLNPVFYAFVGVTFRKHLSSILHRFSTWQNPERDQQVRVQNFISHGSLY